jgi:hypothetical protein
MTITSTTDWPRVRNTVCLSGHRLPSIIRPAPGYLDSPVAWPG